MVKPWQKNPSHTSPATSVIRSPTPARKIFGTPMSASSRGVRREERRHQRVRVELAAELQRRAVQPRVPDRPDGEHHLAHPRRRVTPLHREALGDVRLDLAAETEREPSAGEALQVPADVGERHRVAGEGDGDRRAELELGGVLGGEQQREERVVRRLGGPHAGVADGFELLGIAARHWRDPLPIVPSTCMRSSFQSWSRRNCSSSAASSSPERSSRIGPPASASPGPPVES